MKKRILSGIKPTGTPHIGNYLGSIKQALDLFKTADQSFFFIADAHALSLVSNKWDKDHFKNQIDEVFASLLACGFDKKKTIFYRQSNIPEIFELYWYLSCLCPKGLMNRSHAYKAFLKDHKEEKASLSLYSYPVLMAADILSFKADCVPVGEDQLQHLEIARDLALKFNKRFKKIFPACQAHLSKEKSLVLGIDGKKMSKSYSNVIPLFSDEKILKKQIMRIQTDSSKPGEKKQTKNSILFQLYSFFGTSDEINSLKNSYKEGISWGEVKEILFHKINETFKEKRESYFYYLNHKKEMEEILQEGEKKARLYAKETLLEVKESIRGTV